MYSGQILFQDSRFWLQYKHALGIHRIGISVVVFEPFVTNSLSPVPFGYMSKLETSITLKNLFNIWIYWYNNII